MCWLAVTNTASPVLYPSLCCSSQGSSPEDSSAARDRLKHRFIEVYVKEAEKRHFLIFCQIAQSSFCVTIDGVGRTKDRYET